MRLDAKLLVVRLIRLISNKSLVDRQSFIYFAILEINGVKWQQSLKQSSEQMRACFFDPTTKTSWPLRDASQIVECATTVIPYRINDRNENGRETWA